jgi:hypothetical protein
MPAPTLFFKGEEEVIMKKLATVISTLGLLAGLGGGAAYAFGVVFTPLVLTNGWGGSAPTPAVGLENGIVHFTGFITGGPTTASPFTLSPAFRPTVTRFVLVDCNAATKGFISIDPGGLVFVNPQGTATDCTIFTLLDGVSFAK